jgi:hypothetical protein
MQKPPDKNDEARIAQAAAAAAALSLATASQIG